MYRRTFLAASGTVALAGCPSFGVDDRTSERVERTVPATDGTVLVVENWNGPVTVRGETREDVAIAARREGPADALDRVELSVERVGDAVVVRVRPTEGTPDVATDLQVYVPRSVALDRADTGRGDVAVRSVLGDPRVTTNDGDVAVEGVRGHPSPVTTDGSATVRDCYGVGTVRATNGTADAELREVSRPANVRSVGGDAVLRLFRDIQAEVDVRATGGAVRVEGLEVDVRERADGRLLGRLGEGGETIAVRTEDGDADLRALEA